MARVIEELIEKWTGEELTPSEVEEIKEYHPICKLKAIREAIERGIKRKEDIIDLIKRRCAGKYHGIAKLSKELKERVGL